MLKIFYVAAHVFVMMECKKNYIFPALPSAVTMALGKEFFFKKNSNSAECRPEATRQRFFFKKKIQTLPSAGQGALGK